MKKNSLKAWVLAARPKTLTGAAVPVMIAWALAWKDLPHPLQGWQIAAGVLCLLFAFIMQIDANFVNDYFDFLHGNDDDTRLGPKRACAMGWVSGRAMQRAITLTTATACVVGLPLVWYGGWWLVAVGVLCVVFCFLYTTCLSYHGLGDVLVLVFFGIVPVCVPYYILAHSINAEVIVASIACGIVIDGLLMVNNYRDIDNDRRAGKLTLAVRMGKAWSQKFYLALGIVACLLGIVFAMNGHVWASVLPLIYLLLHVQAYRHMVSIDHGRELNRVLGETARNMFVYGLCVSLGMILSSIVGV